MIALEGELSLWRSLGLGLEPTTLASQLGGTITAIAKDGETLAAGGVLYRVDTEPVVALDGVFPAYRGLSVGVADGRDVRQLEENLVALGYDPDGAITVDRSFTTATEAAVLRMQEDLGAELDGVVDLGEIVFLSGSQRVSHIGPSVAAGSNAGTVGVGSVVQPGSEVIAVASGSSAPSEGVDVVALEQNLVSLGFDPDGEISVDEAFDAATERAIERMQASIGSEVDGVLEPGDVVFIEGDVRVASVLASVGDVVQAGAPLLETTSSEQVVEIELEASRQSLLAVGDEVGLELPDGTEVEGEVAEIGSVARVPASVAGVEPGEPVVDVTVSLPLGGSGGLDRSPVDVLVTSDSVENALAVPVSALVAVAGGGYALELLDAGGTSFVGVELGLFADGLVEVLGNGVREGDEAVVPQ